MFQIVSLNMPVTDHHLTFQPERIDPPDPSNPEYDVRADVWSLGISLVSYDYIEFTFCEKRIKLDTINAFHFTHLGYEWSI